MILNNFSVSNEVGEISGALQGYPSSPLYFNNATSDALKAIRRHSRNSKMYAYADMVIASISVRLVTFSRRHNPARGT